MPTGPPGGPPPGGGGALVRPPATTTHEPKTLAYGRPATAVYVCRDSGAPLPNLRFQGDQWREFEPPVGHFRYKLGAPNADPADPRRLEQCFPLTARGPRVAQVDDRIRVLRVVGKSTTEILFDGFLVAPEGTLDGETESVRLTAIGTPFRERDTPLPGAVMRDCDGLAGPPAPDNTDPARAQDIPTDLPARFNPDGKPNAVPAIAESAKFPGAVNETKYAVFADSRLPPSRGLRLWTLPMAVKYCMMIGNPEETYVKNGDLLRLDDLLKAVRPADGQEFIDPNDDETFVEEPIIVPDLDVTGMAWPDAVRRLIEPHGFGFAFTMTTVPPETTTDSLTAGGPTGVPEWRLKFYRKADGSFAKPAYLQKAPGVLTPGRSNVAQLNLVRDCAGIQNRWLIATEPIVFEASLILAPLFLFGPDDLATDQLPRYVKGMVLNGTENPLFEPALYRRFALAEAGDDHWDFQTETWTNVVTGLRSVLAPDSGAADPRTYVSRRRRPLGKLVSKDAEGEFRDPELWVANNYLTRSPGVWKPDLAPVFGTTKGGDWQRVTKGGWRLMDDMLGIELTMPDPRNWTICDAPFTPQTPSVPAPDGKLSVPDALNAAWATQAHPGGGRFLFRLTVVFEGDHDLDAEAKRRPASPTRFTITRYDDSRDRFEKHIVSKHSHIAAAQGVTIDQTGIDHTKEAMAHAAARRRANEAAAFAGSLTIGYFTDAYQVGDKLSKIIGREIDLAVNAGREQKEAPIYPVIVGVDRNFEPVQTMVFEYQDFRAEPPAEHRRRVHA